MIDETKITPVGALEFTETDVEGTYNGGIVSISTQVDLSDVGLTLVDVETGTSGSINPLVDGGETSAGQPGAIINISFSDRGMSDKLDSGDVFIIHGGTEGDRIILTYIPADDLICYYSIPL